MRLVVGIGEALWDVLPSGKKIGGAPANFAYNVSQFGFRGMAISAVGCDDWGRELTEVFRANGLEYYMPQNNLQTGRVDVSLDANGVPSYTIALNAAWDHIPFDEHMADLACMTDVVCFGSLAQRSEYSRNSIRKFIEHMPESSLRIFDINLRQNFYSQQIIEESLGLCNILKINDEEIEVVRTMLGLDSSDYTISCREIIHRYRIEAVILTCGASCSYVISADEVSLEPTPRVELADTVGAGDSFTAAFCAAYLSGLSIVESHRLAVDTAAYVCSRYGAMSALPQRLTSRIIAK